MLRLVLTTFASSEDAAKVVRTLVEEKLAACGTLLPGARSIYMWKGEIEDAKETMVILKSTEAVLPALKKRLCNLHPYDVPEIVVLDPTGVSPDYAKWIAEQVGE